MHWDTDEAEVVCTMTIGVAKSSVLVVSEPIWSKHAIPDLFHT